MHQYKKLAIWITSRELIVLVYGIVNRLPKSEQYILIPQLLRASISISLNIAEGSGRGTDKDFSHFIDIALGSLYETETCLYLVCDLGYIPETELVGIFEKIDHLARMIYKFKNTLNIK